VNLLSARIHNHALQRRTTPCESLARPALFGQSGPDAAAPGAIQSAHGVRRLNGSADWAAIVHLYDALANLTASPVVAINRAVALSHTHGPAAAWAELDALVGDARLAQYQPYWAARAGVLAQLGRVDEAKAAYARAIGLEGDPAVREFLQGRCAAL